MSNIKNKILVIVESPNKVKTISSILKNAGYSAVVMASVGHIMKLGDGGNAFNSGIYPEQQFKLNLIIAEDKKKLVHELSLQAETADKIFIMTDGDREGELIAWSLLKFCKLPADRCCRAITHEITAKAVINAIENPVAFDDDLVNAGLARMMTDKLIGYGLSPLSKKYIGAKSVGRCQSVGLKLVSDREAEINAFIPEAYFNIYLNFVKDNTTFKAKYFGYKTEQIERFTSRADVNAVLACCNNSEYVVESITTTKHKESPKAAFCTATFQQEAAATLGLRVKDAMSCAQKLFEGVKINGEHKGLITYLRTDSTEIAADFLVELESFIKKTYGKNKYAGPRKTKRKTTDQNGHEALRVVDPWLTPDILAEHVSNSLLVKVYKLIWQRTIASVMTSATITENTFLIDNNGHKFTISTRELSAAGYKSIYDFNDNQLFGDILTLVPNEKLSQPALDVVEKCTQPKPRYTEASLVKELQQREIGRPSTYATIVETILSVNRGYATLEDKHITPTDRGIQLAKYCDRAFPTIINIEYTKEMEDALDKIATGKLYLLDYMNAFYTNLKKVIDATDEVGLAADATEKVCPTCGCPMVVRRSRFGRLFYGCTAYPKCKGIMNI